jgi:hypothetical protein
MRRHILSRPTWRPRRQWTLATCATLPSEATPRGVGEHAVEVSLPATPRAGLHIHVLGDELVALPPLAELPELQELVLAILVLLAHPDVDRHPLRPRRHAQILSESIAKEAHFLIPCLEGSPGRSPSGVSGRRLGAPFLTGPLRRPQAQEPSRVTLRPVGDGAGYELPLIGFPRTWP